MTILKFKEWASKAGWLLVEETNAAVHYVTTGGSFISVFKDRSTADGVYQIRQTYLIA